MSERKTWHVLPFEAGSRSEAKRRAWLLLEETGSATAIKVSDAGERWFVYWTASGDYYEPSFLNEFKTEAEAKSFINTQLSEYMLRPEDFTLIHGMKREMTFVEDGSAPRLI